MILLFLLSMATAPVLRFSAFQSFDFLLEKLLDIFSVLDSIVYVEDTAKGELYTCFYFWPPSIAVGGMMPVRQKGLMNHS
jgi:hypothetical protein